MVNKLNSEKIRLNKFIANSGRCSRREADKFIAAGVVTVNGKAVTEMGFKIGPNDLIKFNGEKVKCELKRYILLNKPKNYCGKWRNISENNSVMNLIKGACKEYIIPIEKLTKIELGVLLFTNDNELAKKLRNTKKNIKSIYQVTLNKNLSHEDLEKIRNGIYINGKKEKLNSISYIKNKKKNELGIEHNQGGIKHVKLIFEHLNYKLILLDRVYFAGLTKKDLPRKKYRLLNKEEISILKRL